MIFTFALTFFLCGYDIRCHADIVTLNDGASLHCQVISEAVSPETGIRYLQIRINNSMIWLVRDVVSKIEKTPEREAAGSDVRELLEKLTKEGKIVTDLQVQLDSTIPPPSAAQEEIILKAADIRGWAYLYENAGALKERKRTPLFKGKQVPTGYILNISPNSRITLEIGEIGNIGLESGSQVRFDEIRWDKAFHSYRLNMRLLKGNLWIEIGKTDSGLKRVIITMNSVKTVLERATLYAATTGKSGAVNITNLGGSGDLNFWRSGDDRPYMVPIGQTIVVSPSSHRLDVVPEQKNAQWNQIVRDWMNWEPEKLAVELDVVVPPLQTFPPFGKLPALHPHRLTIDQTMILPPETRSLGEILDVYKKALERYKYDTGRYPSNEHGLEALTISFDVGGWRGPYVQNNLPTRDLWGSEFVFEVYTEEGKKYPDVRSMGPNRKDDKGLNDDIR